MANPLPLRAHAALSTASEPPDWRGLDVRSARGTGLLSQSALAGGARGLGSPVARD